MPQYHDMGGRPGAGPIDPHEHVLADWERRTDAIARALGAGDEPIIRVDESRRMIESFTPEEYDSLSYYQKRVVSIERLLIEKQILTKDEVDRRLVEQNAR